MKKFRDGDNMNSYHVQDGCFNCSYVFVKYEHDDCPEYYCHLDGSKRPQCGSVSMGESFIHGRRSSKTIDKLYDAWGKWSEEHEVAYSGICDAHEKKLNDEE